MGTFEEEDGDATIALRSDGTGMVNGYYSDDPELSGTWERQLDAIEFVSDFGLTRILISSADELWIWTDVDGSGRSVFERTSDEAEAAESPAESPAAVDPGALCTELSGLVDAAAGLSSGMEAGIESGIPGEQVQLNASDLTLFGLRLEPLVAEAMAAHARTLADAGSAITEAIENGGPLTEVMILWMTPEVINAEAAVQVYHDGESGCGP